MTPPFDAAKASEALAMKAPTWTLAKHLESALAEIERLTKRSETCDTLIAGLNKRLEAEQEAYDAAREAAKP